METDLAFCLLLFTDEENPSRCSLHNMDADSNELLAHPSIATTIIGNFSKSLS